MTESLSPRTVGEERATLRRLSTETPDVVYVGYRTGQLAVQFSEPRDGITAVEVTRVDATVGGATRAFFHCGVTIDDGDESGRGRRGFGHPFPALEWLNETVPDFDATETVYVNEPEESAETDAESDDA